VSSVLRRDQESIDALIRRFSRSVQDAGIIAEARERSEFTSNPERRRAAEKRSAARRRKAARPAGRD
jgi:ribosomal protein S21